MATPVLTVLEEDKHAWFAGRTRAILKYLDAEVGPPVPGKVRKILDIGSGAGNMAHHLAQYGQVFGLDYNPRPLPVAQQRGLPVMQGSGNELPFSTNTFDLVALLDTVEHIPDELGVLYECTRVLKPGGKLIVTVPAFMWLWSQNDTLNAHQRRYTAPELASKLGQHGFQVLHKSYNNFFAFPLAAGLIMLRRGRAEPKLASPHFDDDAYQVEMEAAPPLVNSVLTAVGNVEAALIQRLALPIGTSIICLARK